MKLKFVCLLLSLYHASAAMAIGMGEIHVHSYLGQNLHATIALNDAPVTTQADCLSIGTSQGDIGVLPRSQLSLDRSGATVTLHIRTHEPIRDPVVQFVLRSDCETRLQREYVVLLDPPVSETLTSPVLQTPALAAPAPALSDLPATPAAAPPPPPPAAPRAKRIAPAPSASQTAARATAGIDPKPAVTPPASRLVLSGKHREAAADKASTPNEQTSIHAPTLSPTELSDEQTALSRRLAHLETQLAQLRQRNAALEAANANPRNAVPVSVTPAPVEDAPRWPLYLLALGLLATAGILLTRLQRRTRNTPHASSLASQLQWSPMPTLADLALAQSAAADTPTPQRMADIPPPRDDSTEIKEDILEQAEVFMAHGHGEFAVHLLQEHLRAAPTESPVPWLLLLDLLIRAGDQDGYRAASDDCRRYFNIDLSNYAGATVNDAGQGLANYPHVLERLVQQWNTPAIETTLNMLVVDDRGGARQGFDSAAYREILLLQAIVRENLPPGA